jgi:hypothetical protein
MVKSIMAIVAGFVLTAALNVGTNALLAKVAPGLIPTGAPVTDPAALVLVCAYVAAFGILGCYVTARLAPSRPLFHALVLGGIALAMSIPVTVMAWNDTPAWFNVYNLLAVMPYAYLGGRLRERQMEGQGGTPALA